MRGAGIVAARRGAPGRRPPQKVAGFSSKPRALTSIRCPGVRGEAHVHGVFGERAAPDHAAMRKPAKAPARPRHRSDYWGAFCFVVLVVTVLFAVLTAGPG